MSKPENPTGPKLKRVTDARFPGCVISQTIPTRVESQRPVAYRMVRRGQEYVLQGAFLWQQGTSGGTEWRDIPTILEGA